MQSKLQQSSSLGTDLDLEREARDYLHNAQQFQGDIAVSRDPQKERFAQGVLRRGLWEQLPVACHNLGIDFVSLRKECESLSPLMKGESK